MKIGDFFSSAAHARPVNPKRVRFTAVSRNEVLPGGAPNPTKRAFAATIDAAFVFIGGEGTLNARVEARKALTRRFKDAAASEDEFHIEVTYQILWRSLHEWDERENLVGEKLFPDVDLLRETVEIVEANRLLKAYNQYVAEEHPEGGPQDAAAFPGVEAASP